MIKIRSIEDKKKKVKRNQDQQARNTMSAQEPRRSFGGIDITRTRKSNDYGHMLTNLSVHTMIMEKNNQKKKFDSEVEHIADTLR